MKTINNLENTREPAWRWWCSTHNKRVEVQLLFSSKDRREDCGLI